MIDDGRVEIDSALVRRLVDGQFPQWAGLPLELVDPAGSDHVIHRLGDELAVRVPRHEGAIHHAKIEAEWLPQLAPHLPLAVPVPVAVGEPACGYPWSWAVTRWLDGDVATFAADTAETAATLGQFLVALQRLPASERAPASGWPLEQRDTGTRAAIAELAGVFDVAAMTTLWEDALHAPAWDRPGVWFHGDFHTGNLLTIDGRVSAVIDFGGLGVGDPARDLMMAFTLLSPPSRAVFRRTLAVDDATWLRGRGWALTAGLNAYCSYADSSPRIKAQTTRQITAALAG